MRIIAVSGKAGCGKTTFSNHLKEMLTGEVRVISFAQELKKEAAKEFNLPLKNFYEKKEELCKIDVEGVGLGLTARELLNMWSDHRKKEDPTRWCKLLWGRVENFRKQSVNTVIIDDLRFKHEIQFLKETKTPLKLIRLEPFKEWEKSGSSNHISETDLDKFKDWDKIYKPMHGKLRETAKTLTITLSSENWWADTNKPEEAVKFFPISLASKGDCFQLARPKGNDFLVSDIVYKVHKRRQDGTVILKPFKKIRKEAFTDE